LGKGRHRARALGDRVRDQTLGLIDSVEVSSRATSDDPWALNWLSQNYAGNGRYLIADWDRGSKMTLIANPEWPGTEPYFTRIELLVVPQSSNRLALLQSGDVDIALDLSTQELGTVATSAGTEVLSVPDRQALNLGMNLRNAPFDDVRVRQALSYAAPYDDIVNGVLQGRAVPSQGPISVHSRFFDLYDLGDLWIYETDLDRARSLLAQAGYPNGFSFELIIPQGLPYVEAAAANLKAAYSDIGVDMTIAPVSSASMAERLAQRNFEAFMRGYLTDYVDDPYYHFFLWWGTDVVLNWVGYSNSTVDGAYLGTAEVADDAARRDAYRIAIGQVIEDAPMLWLANADFTLAMRSDITGYVHHPDTLMFFTHLRRQG
jgi:peptide/nickel transport system substrate-binding protein